MAACQCKCGTEIWREYRFNGISPVPHYFNINILRSVGRIDAYRITHCPECGEQLRDDVLQVQE